MLCFSFAPARRELAQKSFPHHFFFPNPPKSFLRRPFASSFSASSVGLPFFSQSSIHSLASSTEAAVAPIEAWAAVHASIHACASAARAAAASSVYLADCSISASEDPLVTHASIHACAALAFASAASAAYVEASSSLSC